MKSKGESVNKEEVILADTSLNVDELKDVLKYFIRNNKYLQSQGKLPIAVQIEGDSGLGKTSVTIQVSEEENLPNFVKLNLAQIEELGDLVGFPIKQFELLRSNGEKKYFDENILQYMLSHSSEWIPTGEHRMSYCPPEWIAGKEGGGILLIDDWNRADMRFIQALMELIDRQQYISWKLPSNWHILLTSNPDNGEYLVSSMDSAQLTRFTTLTLKFDIDCWARWAEKHQIDNRCINFLLAHPELVKPGTGINARSVTNFFNAISSIPNFNKELPLIQMIGSRLGKDSEFVSLFILEINNNLDKIISPSDILFKDEKYVLNKLKEAIGDRKSDEYKAAVAAIIARRIINFTVYHANTNPIDKDVIDRLSKIVSEQVFTTDIAMNLVKEIYNSHPSKFKLMTMNKDLSLFILK